MKINFFAFISLFIVLMWSCKDNENIKIVPDHEYIPVKLNEKWGFLNNDGSYLVYPKFDEVMLFSDGVAAVCLNDKWGFIDTLGRMTIQPSYSEVTIFYQDKAFALTDKKEIISINKKNEVLQHIDAQYACLDSAVLKHLESDPNRIISQHLSGKYGFTNKEGKFVIEPIYEEVGEFMNNLAFVSINGKIGFINRKGKMIVEPYYEATYNDCTRNLYVGKDTLHLDEIISRFLNRTNERSFKGFSSENEFSSFQDTAYYQYYGNEIIENKNQKLAPFLYVEKTHYRFNLPIMKVNKNIQFNYKDGFNHAEDSISIDYGDTSFLFLTGIDYHLIVKEEQLAIMPRIIKELCTQLSQSINTKAVKVSKNYIIENNKLKCTIIAPITKTDNTIKLKVDFTQNRK